MKCPHCGAKHQENGFKCTKCGEKIHVVQKTSRKMIVIGGIVLAILAVAVFAVIYMSSNKTGIFEGEKHESFNEYSWDEISLIARDITLAGNHDGALREAKKNGLLDDNGNLRSDLIKEVKLSDGSVVEVQLVGISNDIRSNGAGKAGLTFMVSSPIDVQPMNEHPSNEGGWEASPVRSWANETLLSMLPEDLKTHVVSVDKQTNNVGSTDSPDAVTLTHDRIWLFSLAEIWGESESDRGYEAVLNREGNQYDLFTDDLSREKVISAIEGSEKLNWWLRSPNPETTDQFYSQGEGYDTEQNYPLSMMADDKLSIVVGFCL